MLNLEKDQEIEKQKTIEINLLCATCNQKLEVYYTYKISNHHLEIEGGIHCNTESCKIDMRPHLKQFALDDEDYHVKASFGEFTISINSENHFMYDFTETILTYVLAVLRKTNEKINGESK